MYSEILIRFGELSTKGKNKMSFVRQLEKNIKKLIGIASQVEFDRIFLPYSIDTMHGLQKIFGIHSYSPVVKTKTTLEDIELTIKKIIEKQTNPTFKILVKRHWKNFPWNSSQLNKHFGTMVIKQKGFKVDIKNPQLKLEIEIRKNFTYVFIQRTKGLGGYPVGINGKMLHMMSGGIDSPVAALELMKRGLHVDFLNFITPPHTDNKTIEKVNKIIQLLNSYQGQSTLYRSNYTDLMNLIGLTSNQSYKIILMRRSFYRIGMFLAKQHDYLGISNGENLGQVASQTLESMMVVQNQLALPIYRPILTADKLETIQKAIKIGTYAISIEQAFETCELFAPKTPIIKPKIHQVEFLEKELSNLLDMEHKNIENNITKFKISW